MPVRGIAECLYEEPDVGKLLVRFCEGHGVQLMYGRDIVAPPGNQAANRENKHQPKYLKKPVYSTQLKMPAMKIIKNGMFWEQIILYIMICGHSQNIHTHMVVCILKIGTLGEHILKI